jgi:hypothetical protein
MTCREFKHSAEALTLWELSRAQNRNEGERISNHAEQCDSCGSWVREQRLLAASLGTLQARTASLEASADVERAVLQAFRQNRATLSSAALQPAGGLLARDAGRTAKREERLPLRSLPLAVRLSHWFEIGAYVAVAAAVIVGMFLGIRLLGHRSSAEPRQAKVSPAIVQPAVQKPIVAAEAESPNLTAVAANKSATVERHSAAQPAAAQKRTTAAPQPVADDDSQSDNDAGYTALMICDPLSCSSDSQVVRMELPVQPGQAQSQVADVVVGYDGAVRAVRIVN